MIIVKRNQQKSKHPEKLLARYQNALWKNTVDTLVKLLPLLTSLLTTLMPLIILIGTHRHWF